MYKRLIILLFIFAISLHVKPEIKPIFIKSAVIPKPKYLYTYTNDEHVSNLKAVTFINSIKKSSLNNLCVDGIQEAINVSENSKNDSSTIFVYMEKVIHMSNKNEYQKHRNTIKRYATKEEEHPETTLTKSAIEIFSKECIKKPYKTLRKVANSAFEETVKKSYKLFFQHVVIPTILGKKCSEIFNQYTYLPRSNQKGYIWLALMEEVMRMTSPARYNEYRNLKSLIKSKKLSDNTYFMVASDNFMNACLHKDLTVRDAAKIALVEALDPFYKQ